MLKVKMTPDPRIERTDESGIITILRKYKQHMPDFGVQFVDEGYDVHAIHAGMGDRFIKNEPIVAINHGLYWTAEYNSPAFEWGSNADVIKVLRHAREITVPSKWVSETLERDMHITPHVIPHGVDWEDWQDGAIGNYSIGYSKNRAGQDVCNPAYLTALANQFPQELFWSTFANSDAPLNVKRDGLLPHKDYAKIVKGCKVYVSCTPETFGIGVLEAMASGKPILGWRYGGNIDLVKHGINGYLAEPGNYDDLKEGMNYCLKYAATLGDNGREMALEYTWEKAIQAMVSVFELATKPQPATVAVVIPSFNYGDRVGEAVKSAQAQSYALLTDIVIVDDGSKAGDGAQSVVQAISLSDKRVRYIRQANQGVAVARNTGVLATNTKYICCLDADDLIRPEFLDRCVRALESDSSLGIAYTAITVTTDDGLKYINRWPPETPSFELQLHNNNQIPTCCLFRREMFDRLGGFRARYAPMGCGTEDADLWLRAGSIGYGYIRSTAEELFEYKLGGYTTGNRQYKEVNWTGDWHPWCDDGQHPFASIAQPKKHSHPVRMYDTPVVSVVIPVGEKHTTQIIDALDSLEAQTYRKWEVIVVWDFTAERLYLDQVAKAYPFIKQVFTDHKGAGYARNRGVEKARGKFILFLDADDWLDRKALNAMLESWGQQKAIVYSDYYGKAFIDNPEQLDPGLRAGIVNINPKTKETTIRHHAAKYDPDLAQKQPVIEENGRCSPYLWCNVTCLVPTVWHNEIGGFDETMDSWEDVDYHWRMAKAGKCYNLIDEPLMTYRFYTGTRRETGLQNHQRLLQYMSAKHKDIPIMACGCSGNKTPQNRPTVKVPVMAAVTVNRQQQSEKKPMNGVNSDSNFVLVDYLSLNTGEHGVVGMSTRTNYGYRKGGDKFIVHVDDIAIQPHLFKLVASNPDAPAPVLAPPPVPIPITVPVDQPIPTTIKRNRRPGHSKTSTEIGMEINAAVNDKEIGGHV